MPHKKTKTAHRTHRPSNSSSSKSANWIFVIVLVLIGIFAWKYAGSTVNPSQAGLEDQTVFVSSLGKDTNTGTYASPLRTVRKALTVTKPNTRLNIVLVGPIFVMNNNDLGNDGPVIEKNQNVVISGGATSANIPVVVTVDTTDNTGVDVFYPRNKGDLEIRNLRWLNIMTMVQSFGPLEVRNNIYESTDYSAHLSVTCIYTQCNVQNNRFKLPTKKISQNSGFSSLSADSDGDTSRINIKDNTFLFPSISTDWPQNWTLEGITLSRVWGETTGNIFIGRNTFLTDKYSGLKAFAGEVGMYLAGDMTGVNIGTNNFAKFSGLPSIYVKNR